MPPTMVAARLTSITCVPIAGLSPAVIAVKIAPGTTTAEPIASPERQPESLADQSRCPARDQRQEGQREEAAGLFFRSDVRVRLGLH
jgi:hypothetical protein